MLRWRWSSPRVRRYLWLMVHLIALKSTAFGNLANTEAEQKAIGVEASDFRDTLLEIPEHGSVAVSWLVEEPAKAAGASANSSTWEDLRLLLPA